MSAKKSSINYVLNHTHTPHKDDECKLEEEICQISKTESATHSEENGMRRLNGLSDITYNRDTGKSTYDLAVETSSRKQNPNVTKNLKVSSLAKDNKHKTEQFRCELCNQTFTEKGKIMSILFLFYKCSLQLFELSG